MTREEAITILKNIEEYIFLRRVNGMDEIRIAPKVFKAIDCVIGEDLEARS